MDAAIEYPQHRESIERLYNLLDKSAFKTPDDMKGLIPSLDNFKHQKGWWVIDIAGNHLRFIGFINFKTQQVFVRHIVSHAEYDKLCQRYTNGELP